MTRTRLPLDERRAQLLAAAFELFASRPWEDVSMDEIAARAGVSKALLYHYFPSKRDLYLTLVERADADLRRAMQPDPALPAAERLHAGVDAYLRYVEEHHERYAAFVRGFLAADAVVQHTAESTRRLVVEQIAGGMTWPDGVAPPAVRLAVRGWVAYVETVALEWLGERPSDRLPRTAVCALLVGVLNQTIAVALGVAPATTDGTAEPAGHPA